MKLTKIFSGFTATVLLACAAPAVTAYALGIHGEQDKPGIVIYPSYRDMPLKGDANGDGKIDTKDTAILRDYLNGVIKIKENSDRYGSLDTNWDGKVNKRDLALMPGELIPKLPEKKTGVLRRQSCVRTGDLNFDGVVNDKDLNLLREKAFPEESPSWSVKLPVIIFGSYDKYDLNANGIVDKTDYYAMEEYITVSIFGLKY